MPREDDVIGEDDGLAEYTLKREEKYRPSRVLEDVLVGTTLRIAKERLISRDSTSEGEEDAQGQNDEVAEGSHREVIDGEDEQESIPQFSKPIVSTDDERSRDILRPTIRHNLTRLDELLMALHHSRQACLRGISEESDMTQVDSNFASQDERETSRTTGPSTSKKRKVSNSSRQHSQRSESVSMERSVQQTVELLLPPPMKNTNRGRPRKIYPRLPDESDYDFAVRIARLKKQPKPPRPPSPSQEPTRSPAASIHSTLSRRPSRSRTPKKRQNSETDWKVDNRWQSRDWSEVLGAAAIIGFPQGAVARATQRCANLFGEGMVMRKLDHELPTAGEVVTYLPQKVAPLDMEGSSGEEVEEDTSQVSKKKKSKTDVVAEASNDSVKAYQRAPKAVVQTVWCPIPECVRNKHGFGRSNHLKRHLITQHEYVDSSPELRQALIAGKGLQPTETVEEPKEIVEEMESGVHVDGFMRVVAKVKMGRGKDLGVRKEGTGKRRWSRGGVSGSEDVGEDDIEDMGDEKEEEIPRRKTRNAKKKEAGSRVTNEEPAKKHLFNELGGDNGMEEFNQRLFIDESSGSDYAMDDDEENVDDDD